MSYQYHDQLQSSRLTTRFITPEDVGPWTNFFKDPEAVELFPTWGLNTIEERAQYWINRQLTRYKEQRYGHQILTNKETGEFIGQSGLILQEVDGQFLLEVGYHIFKKYWGQGYAPEAAKLFLTYAFEHNLSESVISIIDVRNSKSMRVADKNGLIRERQTRWMDLDVYIYRIDRDSFYHHHR